MESIKYYYSEEFIKKVFQQIEGVEIESSFENNMYDKRFGDFSLYLNGKKYIVEIKTKFSNVLLARTLTHMNSRVNNRNNILIVLDKIPSRFKEMIMKDYLNVDVWDISNVLYFIYDNDKLQRELSRIVEFSLDSVTPVEPSSLFKKKKSIVENIKKDYKLLLSNIKNGRRQAKEYEKLLEEMIKEFFSNELAEFVQQSRTEDGINIFDMICKIKNDVDDEFFSTIEKFFKSKYILFEFKNYTELIKQGEICTTEKYLYETALRKVAIIITRKGIDTNGGKMISGILRETGKLMIVLNDEDIHSMIELYEKNEKVSMVLSEKLDKLLTTLEK